jgi:hypothetical protein
MSNEITNFTGVVSYDFSTALTQAFRFYPLDTDPMTEIDGVFCLWTGDMNGDGNINFLDISAFTTDFSNSGTLNGTYISSDFNMNGIINFIDASFITFNASLMLRSSIFYFIQ